MMTAKLILVTGKSAAAWLVRKLPAAAVAFLVLLAACSRPGYEKMQPDMHLWYEQPANVWVEALPVGNGRLGAMVFGHPFTERIQLNEESLWAGSPINNNNPDASGKLPLLRRP